MGADARIGARDRCLRALCPGAVSYTHLDVYKRQLVGPASDIGAAAHQRLERLGAALEIADADLQSLLAEIAAPLGDRQRQICHQRLAAHRHMHRRLLEIGGVRRRERDRDECYSECHRRRS